MAELTVIYGSEPRRMVVRLLESIRPEQGLPLTTRIALKPNLAVAKPWTSGATTSPEIAAGVIEYFQGMGYRNLIIIESSWLGDDTERAFKVCGFDALSRRYQIPLYDLKKDGTVKKRCDDLTLELCKKAAEAEYLVNLPVLKAHCQTKLTCALKNLKGCIPDREKRRFHSLGLHKPIAALNRLLRTDLVVVDALMGDLSFEEGGNPVEMGRIIAGFDPVLVDSYAARLIGIEAEEIQYLTLAHQMGRGLLFGTDSTLTELDRDKKPPSTPARGQHTARLAKYIREEQACSPCYGSLIHALHRLDEKGELPRLKCDSIHIGRGFKGKKGTSIGIGSCTGHLETSLPGCPPPAFEIILFLRSLIR